MWLTEHSSRSESDVQKLIKYVDIFNRNSEKKILTSPRHCFFCMQDYALKPKVFNQKINIFNIVLMGLVTNFDDLTSRNQNSKLIHKFY